MLNTKAFNEQVLMIGNGILRNKINSIILIHTETDGNVVSGYSVEIKDSSDVFKIIGALESMKKTIMDNFLETEKEYD